MLTGDALFCQRSVCQQVLDAGGDYLLVVRENQPALYEAIHLLFDPPPALAPAVLTDLRAATTRDRGHGRQDEVRTLVASTDLTGYLDWPGLAQVFRLERTWREHGLPKHALRYGITSPAPDAGPPARLLALKCGQRGIEHGLHRVKDLALGEDQSTVHCGRGPTVLALLRDVGVSLLHRAGIRQITACLRTHGQDPAPAVALVIAAPPSCARA